MTDFIQRLASLGTLPPEIAFQVLGTVIDGIGTGAEFSGEELERLGEMAQELADKIRGIKESGDAG